MMDVGCWMLDVESRKFDIGCDLKISKYVCEDWILIDLVRMELLILVER